MIYLRLASFVLCLVVLTSCTIEDYNHIFPPEKQIAHRGYWTAGAHENSLQAMQYAIDVALYGAEIDVYETSDGVMVVSHDPVYNGYDIIKSTYRELVLSTTNKQDVLPSLMQFLELLVKYPNFSLLIDIKLISNVEALIHLVERYSVSSQVEFISFNKSICDALINFGHEYTVGYMGDIINLQSLVDDGYRFISLSKDVYLANPNIVNEARYYGFDVYAWTVNDVNEMSALYDMGVSRIITDYPRVSHE